MINISSVSPNHINNIQFSIVTYNNTHFMDHKHSILSAIIIIHKSIFHLNSFP
ncbi:hypothetical protein DsansV1_C41g0237641 [Dioscorea sansibarensis]